jgi:hypothetical protein
MVQGAHVLNPLQVVKELRMRRAAKLSSVGLTLALVVIQCAPARAAGLGVLRGVVRDQYGAPLVGASVAIFDVAAKKDKPVRNTSTDDSGQFEASVAPGRYLLRAVASGFDAFEARARVAADRETVLDTIALRRVDTFADRQRATTSDPYRQVVRSSRGRVFQMQEATEDAREQADAQALALTDRDNAAHGVVQTVATTGASSYVATNFAVERRVGRTDLTVVGQTGVGDGAPLRLEATTSTDIGDSHRATVTLGYGRLRVEPAPGAGDATLDQYTLQAVDRWQVADPLVIVYGVNFTRFAGASDATATLPRFGVEFSPTRRTQLFAHMTPGSAPEQIASFNLETGEVTFVEPQRANVAGDRLAEATPDRSRRFEVGVGHVIDERSNVEVMAFYDIASGRGIGFLAVPTPGADPEFRTGELDGRTSGLTVLYTRRLSRTLTGTVGYAVGQGLALAPDALAHPEDLYRPTTFQVFTGQLEADLDTGTRISAVYRFSPNAVVFAIDPFAGRMTAYEPSASFVVAQTLPVPDFFPGQWEALLDVRNVFASVPATEDRELMLADYSRLVRAGLSFRF